MRIQLLACVLVCVFLSSCGGNSACTIVGMDINPSAAVADHNASSPGNSVQFIALPTHAGGGACEITTVRLLPTWTLSDDVNVSVSNAPDATNGTATCINATATPVTVTATLPKGPTQSKAMVATTKLTCK